MTTNYINCNDFDPKNVDFGRHFNDTNGNFTKYPIYRYMDDTDTLSIVTDEIVMCYGGIPDKDNKYRLHNDQCFGIRIPLDSIGDIRNKGGESLCEIMREIDTLTRKSIDSRDFFKSGAGSTISLNENLSYTPCVRKGNDEGYYMVARLKTDNNGLIKTRVTTLDNDSDAQPMKIKTLDDLRKLMVHGSKIIFQIDLVKTVLILDEDDVGFGNKMVHSFIIKQMLIKPIEETSDNILVDSPAGKPDILTDLPAGKPDILAESIVISNKPNLAQQMKSKAEKSYSLLTDQMNKKVFDIVMYKIDSVASIGKFNTFFDLGLCGDLTATEKANLGIIVPHIVLKLRDHGFKARIGDKCSVFDVEWN